MRIAQKKNGDDLAQAARFDAWRLLNRLEIDGVSAADSARYLSIVALTARDMATAAHEEALCA